jgi:hypothetical protein
MPVSRGANGLNLVEANHVLLGITQQPSRPRQLIPFRNPEVISGIMLRVRSCEQKKNMDRINLLFCFFSAGSLLSGLSFIVFFIYNKLLFSPPSPLVAAKAGINHHGIVEDPLPLSWDRRAIQPNHIS